MPIFSGKRFMSPAQVQWAVKLHNHQNEDKLHYLEIGGDAFVGDAFGTSTANAVGIQATFTTATGVSLSEVDHPIGAGGSGWFGFAASANGQYVYAGPQFDQIQVSSDYGVTFAPPAGGPTGITGSHIVCSANGQYVLFSDSIFSLHWSNDHGVTWFDTGTGTMPGHISDLTMSSDGSVFVVVDTATSPSKLFISLDSGATWNNSSITGTVGNSVAGLSISADFQRIMFAESGGDIFRSTNGGASFSGLSQGSQTWNAGACSSDGLICAYTRAESSTTIHYSLDGGNTWHDVNTPAGMALSARGISLSSNGSYILLADSSSTTTSLAYADFPAFSQTQTKGYGSTNYGAIRIAPDASHYYVGSTSADDFLVGSVIQSQIVGSYGIAAGTSTAIAVPNVGLGIAAVAAAGNLFANVAKPLTGVVGTTAAGTVSLATPRNVSITGVSATAIATAVYSSVGFNPAFTSTDLTLSGSNLVVTKTGGFSDALSIGSKAIVGKVYAEITATHQSGFVILGVATLAESVNNQLGLTSSVGAAQNGNIFGPNNGFAGGGPSFSQGSVVGMAVDTIHQKIWWTVDGSTWAPSGSPVTNTGGFDISAISGDLYFAIEIITPGDIVTGNFGASSFSFTMPSGFSKLDAGDSGTLLKFAIDKTATGAQANAIAGSINFSQNGSGSPIGVVGTTTAGVLFANVAKTLLGVQANSAVGTITIRVDDTVTLTGVQANAASGTASVQVDDTVTLTGVQANATVGTLTIRIDDSFPLTGVQANAIAGIATGSSITSPNVAITGVQANTVAGTPFANVATFVIGVQANSVVGTVTIRVDDTGNVTGVQANSAVGTPAITINKTLTGVQANALSGLLFANVVKTIAGVQGNTIAGTVSITASGNVSITGSQANATAGIVSLKVDKLLSGIQANAISGTVTTRVDDSVTLIGAQANAVAGSPTGVPGQLVEIDGAQGNAIAGDVSFIISPNTSIIGAQSSATIGSLSLAIDTAKVAVGAQANALAGTVKSMIAFTLPSVQAETDAGDVSFSISPDVSVTGAASIALAGILRISETITIIGVQATAVAQTPSLSITANAHVLGTNSIAIAGDVEPAINKSIIGVAGNSIVGIVSRLIEIALEGAEITADAGELITTSSANTIISGASALSMAGHVSLNISFMNGVQALARAGDLLGNDLVSFNIHSAQTTIGLSRAQVHMNLPILMTQMEVSRTKVDIV